MTERDDEERWRAWRQSVLQGVEDPARRVLEELDSGSEAAPWLERARRRPSVTVQVIHEWWRPESRHWVTVPGLAWRAEATPSGVLMEYPEPWDDDPVALARLPYLAYRAGRLSAAVLAARMGPAVVTVADGAPLDLYPALSGFRAWYLEAGRPAWAHSWDAQLAGQGVEVGREPPRLVARQQRDDMEEVMELYRLGLPPHRPPGQPPLDPGLVLLAAAALEQMADRPPALSRLTTHALYAAVLSARWKEASGHGDQ